MERQSILPSVVHLGSGMQGHKGRLAPEPLLLATLLHSIPTTLLQEYQSHKLQCVGSLGAGLHRQP